MDIAQKKFKYKCQKHPDFKIEFLQIENLQANKQDQNLFYCSDCANKDSNFKLSNYQLIKNVVQSGEDQIHSNWPPVNDNNLLSQLIEISQGNEEKRTIEAEIESYFTDLKAEIQNQIDIYQRKMLQQVKEFPTNKAQILSRYQELSKLNQLRSILVDNDTDINEKQRQYRVLIEGIQSEKKTITEQLTSLLKQYQNQQFNSPDPKIKESILKSISTINLFKSPNIQSNTKIENPAQLDLSLFTADYDDGNNYTEIIKNKLNQTQITMKEESDDFLNIVSDLILSQDTKYIFRIQIQMLKLDDVCQIGLMQDCHIHNKSGYQDNLECRLEYINQNICEKQYESGNSSGICNYIKGEQLILSKENMIEMRVCLSDQILEILDYPNYSCKIQLQDKYKNNLITFQNLRLYLSMTYLNNSMTIKEAFTVDEFE